MTLEELRIARPGVDDKTLIAALDLFDRESRMPTGLDYSKERGLRGAAAVASSTDGYPDSGSTAIPVETNAAIPMAARSRKKQNNPFEPVEIDGWEPLAEAELGPVPSSPIENKKRNKGVLGDTGTDLKIGIEKLPAAISGLSDLVNPATYITGRRIADEASDWLGDKTGFQPSKWAKEAESEYSPERVAAQKEADAAWDNASLSDFAGSSADIAAAYAKNPRLVLGLIAQSLPSTIGGAGIARGLMKGVLGTSELLALREASLLEGKAGDAARASLQLYGRIAGATGEGAITAGNLMSEIDPSVPAGKAAMASTAGGVITGLIGERSGKLASKIGLPDVDTVLAGGGAGRIVRNEAGEIVEGSLGAMPWGKRAAVSAVQEGPIEEGLQSSQEKMWQNAAEDKPIMQGVARQAVEGSLAGAGMGVGASLLRPTDAGAQQSSQPTADITVEQTPGPNISIEGFRDYARERLAELSDKAATLNENGKASGLTAEEALEKNKLAASLKDSDYAKTHAESLGYTVEDPALHLRGVPSLSRERIGERPITLPEDPQQLSDWVNSVSNEELASKMVGMPKADQNRIYGSMQTEGRKLLLQHAAAVEIQNHQNSLNQMSDEQLYNTADAHQNPAVSSMAAKIWQQRQAAKAKEQKADVEGRLKAVLAAPVTEAFTKSADAQQLLRTAKDQFVTPDVRQQALSQLEQLLNVGGTEAKAAGPKMSQAASSLLASNPDVKADGLADITPAGKDGITHAQMREYIMQQREGQKGEQQKQRFEQLKKDGKLINGHFTEVTEDQLGDKTENVDLKLGGKTYSAKRISKGDFQRIQKIAGFFGKKVVLVRDEAPDAKTYSDGFVDTTNDPDTVYINQDATSAGHMAILGHELTHHLEKALGGKIYKTLSESIDKHLNTNAEEFQRKHGGYGALDKEGVFKEIRADLMGNRFGKQEFWEKVFKEVEAKDAGLAKRIKDTVVSWMKGVANRMSVNKEYANSEKELISQLRGAATAVDKAYVKAAADFIKTANGIKVTKGNPVPKSKPYAEGVKPEDMALQQEGEQTTAAVQESKGVRPVSASDIPKIARLGFEIRAGGISGAPPFIHNLAGIKKQIAQMVTDAKSLRAHPEDAVWYREAGRAIREYSHGDLALQEKLTRIVAKLSQSSGVDSNVTGVIKAAYQIAKGETPSVGIYPNKFREEFGPLVGSKKFDDSLTGVSTKLQNFYRNLHDEAFQKNEWPDAVVIDRHAIGYVWNDKKKSTVGSDAQYDYAQRLMQLATVDYNNANGTNLKPRDMQALLWGWWKRKADAEKAKAEGKEYNAPGTAWNYPEFFERGTANITAETIPSTRVADLSGLSLKDRRGFQKEALDIIFKDGNNELARRSGLVLYTQREGTGGFDGQTSPNLITGALAKKTAKLSGDGGKFHYYTYHAVDRYALGWQYIFQQDGVPWFRADRDINPSDLDAMRQSRADREFTNVTKGGKQKIATFEIPEYSAGVFFEFKSELTEQDEAELFAALRNEVHPDVGYTKLSPSTISVVNFRGDDRYGFLTNKDGSAMSDAEFIKAAEHVQLSQQLFDKLAGTDRFGAESKYHAHDWKTDQTGKGILDAISNQQEPGLEQGQSDLQDWLRGRAEDFKQLVAKYAGRSNAAGGGRSAGSNAQESSSVQSSNIREYGEATEGSVSVTGVHYSRESRPVLEGKYFGTGIKGAEADRVRWAKDARLRERIYFYVDSGKGIRPEQGVGSKAHPVQLNNLYDADKDSSIQKGINRGPDREEYLNNFESAVIDAGYDGYVTQFGNDQRAAILIGTHKVETSAVQNSALRELTIYPLGTDEKAITNDIPTKYSTPAGKTAYLKKLTRENTPIIKRIVSQIESNFSVVQVKPNEKEFAKIMEKAVRPSILQEKPWHGVEHIRDSYRFKAVLNNYADLPGIINLLQEEGVTFAKVDLPKVLYPKEWGFRIASFDMKMPNGQLIEFYTPIKEIEEAKGVNHMIFERWRNLPASQLTMAQKRNMLLDIADSYRRYRQAFDASLARNGSTDNDVLASLFKVAASFSGTSPNDPNNSNGSKTASLTQRPLTREAKKSGTSDSTTNTLDRSSVASTSIIGNSSGNSDIVNNSSTTGTTDEQLLQNSTLREDLDEQTQWLSDNAAKAGFVTLDDMLAVDPAKFFALAEQWRTEHPEEFEPEYQNSVLRFLQEEQRGWTDSGVIPASKMAQYATAIGSVVDAIKGGQRLEGETVPIMPVPAVLRQLNVPSQWITASMNISQKMFADEAHGYEDSRAGKHRADFQDLSAEQIMAMISDPLVVLRSARGSDQMEIITSHMGEKGPIMFAITLDTNPVRGSNARMTILRTGFSLTPGQIASKIADSKAKVLYAKSADEVNEMYGDAVSLNRAFNREEEGSWVKEIPGASPGKTRPQLPDTAKNQLTGQSVKNPSDTVKWIQQHSTTQRSGLRESAADRVMDFAAPNQLAGAIRDRLSDALRGEQGFNFLHKTVGTQMHKARLNPAFGKVFDLGQKLMDYTAMFAMRAQELAPSILPDLGNLRLRSALPWNWGEGLGLKEPDNKKLGELLAMGTLENGADPHTGKVYTDAELRSKGATAEQIKHYREARAAIDQTIDDSAKSLMLMFARQAGIDPDHLDVMAENSFSLKDTRDNVERMLLAANKVKSVADLNKVMFEANSLKSHGYAPLMRFGQYTVTVESTAGDKLWFSMHESQADAMRTKAQVSHLGPAKVGKLNDEQYKLFQSISPGLIEAFANNIPLNTKAEKDAMQEYLRLTTSNRSALQRMMKREGIAGYSTDATRVLAHYVTSNARQNSKMLVESRMMKSVQEITESDAQKEAQQLFDYIRNPGEGAQKIRGFLFFNFLGGSLAAGLVNLTQPVLMTLPYLQQFGFAKANNAMFDGTKAAAQWLRGKKVSDPGLAAAMQKAHELGIINPQEIFQLMAAAETGTSSMLGQKLMRLWGTNFAITEAFNRTLTFASAYKIGQFEATKKGLSGIDATADAFKFAVTAVEDTQGLYNKGNRPNWARETGTFGAAGTLAFTFKQYSIAYVEFLKRLWDSKGGKAPFWSAVAMLVLAAGANGLPGSDDLDDLIETIMAWAGHPINMKKQKRQALITALNEIGMGAGAADTILNGVSEFLPIDVQSRLGLANLIPGTSLANPMKADKGTEFASVFGPVGGVVQNMAKAGAALGKGDVWSASKAMAPKAVADALKGYEMASTGEIRDGKNRLVGKADGVDAFVKTIGFQPEDFAKKSRAMRELTTDIEAVKYVQDTFNSMMANAIREKDADKRQAALELFNSWNKDNPELRIKYSMTTIMQRIKQMNLTQTDRFIKATPKAQRQMAQSLLSKVEDE